MNPARIQIDAAISLGPGLEARLAMAGFTFTYGGLLPAAAPWEEIDVCLLHSYLPDGTLQRMKRCRYIGIRAVRTDYVNLPLAAAMGITVQGLTRQHGVNAVAEHTFALIFGLAKHLVAGDANVKGGQWRAGLPANFELKGKTLGIVGFGKIGQRVAEIGRALGMKVLVSGRGRMEGEASLDDLLARADIISLHITGSEANRHFLNRERLARMKEGALVINTTRGLVVDHDALAEALRTGKIAGAGLDVFPEEPLTRFPFAEGSPVLCTPHTAFNTREALAELNEELADHLLAWWGERPAC
jgi:phosphoglycerate dehydrogenase-like enzyme